MGWRSKRNRGGATGDLIENILGRTSLFRGDFSADGAFRIDGWVEGSVESRSAVIIGESGAVRGNVTGTEVVVAGQVFGNVRCSGHLEILATGKIEGNIDAASVRIETGGVFRGLSHMGNQIPLKGELVAVQHETQEAAEATEAPEAPGDVPPYHAEFSPAV